MRDETERQQLPDRFLKALCEQTDGNTQHQVSMYSVGQCLGLDRQAASLVAQDLMAEGAVEIKTLSGGIGITVDGLARVGRPDAPEGSAGLPESGFLSPAHCQAVDSALAAVKTTIGARGWRFEDLAQAVADIRTIEAQIAAPRPKSAVVRPCIETLAAQLADSGPCPEMILLRRLLGRSG